MSSSCFNVHFVTAIYTTFVIGKNRSRFSTGDFCNKFGTFVIHHCVYFVRCTKRLFVSSLGRELTSRSNREFNEGAYENVSYEGGSGGFRNDVSFVCSYGDGGGVSCVYAVGTVGIVSRRRYLLYVNSGAGHCTRLSITQRTLHAAFPSVRFNRVVRARTINDNFRSPFDGRLTGFDAALSPSSIHSLFGRLRQHDKQVPRSGTRKIMGLSVSLLIFSGGVLGPRSVRERCVHHKVSILF